MTKKTWKEKLHVDNGLPQVKKMIGKTAERYGKGKMLIPHPTEVDEIMKKVKKGKLITNLEIRKELCQKHQADICCPMTTGIFSWISAHHAEEEKSLGKKRITPYWRTLKNNYELNPKYPGGIENQKKLLEEEGHQIIQKGKRFFVEK